MLPTKFQTREIEGRWEELVKNVHQFEGRRVRITVLDDQPANGDQNSNAIQQWIAQAAQLEPDLIQSSTDSNYSDLLAEKYKRQGLIL